MPPVQNWMYCGCLYRLRSVSSRINLMDNMLHPILSSARGIADKIYESSHFQGVYKETATKVGMGVDLVYWLLLWEVKE